MEKATIFVDSDRGFDSSSVASAGGATFFSRSAIISIGDRDSESERRRRMLPAERPSYSPVNE